MPSQRHCLLPLMLGNFLVPLVSVQPSYSPKDSKLALHSESLETPDLRAFEMSLANFLTQSWVPVKDIKSQRLVVTQCTPLKLK